MLRRSLLILALLIGATVTHGQDYWPSEGETTFNFDHSGWGNIEYTFSRDGMSSSYSYRFPLVSPYVTITFDHDAEGNLRLVGSTSSLTTHSRSTNPDRPIVLLRAQAQLGATEIHTGTCTIVDSHAPDELFAFIARITVLGYETITVPAGTFETLKLNIENAWPPDLNGIVYLDRELGLVKFSDNELESWSGQVAAAPSSWGAVKALYR